MSKKNKQPLSHFTKLTLLVVLLHVVVFLLASGSLSDPKSLLFLQEAPKNWVLDPEEWTARPWTLLTGALMHGGLIHLAVNMQALYSLSKLAETTEQIRVFVVSYLVGLAFSSTFIVLFSSGTPTVGASGAIFGVCGALFASWLFEHLRSALWIFLALNFAITFAIPLISWQAHLGGFIGGYLVGVIHNYWSIRSQIGLIRRMSPEAVNRSRSYYMAPLALSVLGSYRASDVLEDRLDDYIETMQSDR